MTVEPRTRKVLVLDNSGGQVVNSPLIFRVDEASATATYIGFALPGTATSAATWRILKIDTTSGTFGGYADSVSTLTKVWDDRAGYTYG